MSEMNEIKNENENTIKDGTSRRTAPSLPRISPDEFYAQHTVQPVFGPDDIQVGSLYPCYECSVASGYVSYNRERHRHGAYRPVREQLIEFLKALEKAVPPPANAHHAITFAQYGSDETGWDDRLALNINADGVWICFFLDENDFGNVDLVIAQIQHDIQIKACQPPTAAAKVESDLVYSDPDCIFNYCPHPAVCKAKGCQSKCPDLSPR